jgi:hypothetical protein
MTFPGVNAVVDYNEMGEPVSWDYPNDDADSYYCDMCGFNHQGACPDDDEDEDEESIAEFYFGPHNPSMGLPVVEDEEPNTNCHCGHPECGAC